LALLVTIPGIDWVVAATVIAEIGVDMSVFPSHRHLAAWGGTCPGNNESAGKRKPIGARKGNPDLKTALCNVATAASRKRGSIFKAKYQLKAHAAEVRRFYPRRRAPRAVARLRADRGRAAGLSTYWSTSCSTWNALSPRTRFCRPYGTAASYRNR
jgi:transposase